MVLRVETENSGGAKEGTSPGSRLYRQLVSKPWPTKSWTNIALTHAHVDDVS